ncbi:hypothetical protein CYLTODRAFT_453123 [Cylindrobasidium torrendii FP15055 ss-10]|uniref:Uncharacterized protein n=1 Tax=Cylindrobasidium torrendii FP15055 ss-10 TaxID=1314674 RepID=A0A0D7BGV3_9AGAR|nr:hypothetical protein CYLTODRAFT_453123 [Cylindrobasidium torrendii FP15055 ss-10]
MPQDISRFAAILDPSHYHTQSSPVQPRVYMDRKGNMHDPDYHLFPVAPASPTYTHTSLDSEEEFEAFSTLSSSRRSSISSYSPSSSSFTYSPIGAASNLPCPSTIADRLTKRTSKCNRRVSLDSYVETEEEEEFEEEPLEFGVEEQEKDKNRCGSDAVKRELHSIALSMSIGVFRARRRVKNALRR